MYQEGGSPGSAIGSRPVPRRRKKSGFFTPQVLLLLTAVLLTLVGILLIMSSAVGFFSEDYPPPKIIIVTNVTPSPTIAVVITDNATPCSSVGKICDADDPSAVFQPIYTDTVLGNATLIYHNNITYPYYSVYGHTSLKAVNIYPVTVLVIEYLVPDVTVKKVIVDKRIITNGFLTDTTYKTVYVTYPDPEARFEIKIYDESGALVAAEGLGGQYDTGMKDVITFLTQGNYTIEMTGKRIEFEVSIIEK